MSKITKSFPIFVTGFKKIVSSHQINYGYKYFQQEINSTLTKFIDCSSSYPSSVRFYISNSINSEVYHDLLRHISVEHWKDWNKDTNLYNPEKLINNLKSLNKNILNQYKKEIFNFSFHYSQKILENCATSLTKLEIGLLAKKFASSIHYSIDVDLAFIGRDSDYNGDRYQLRSTLLNEIRKYQEELKLKNDTLPDLNLDHIYLNNILLLDSLYLLLIKMNSF